MPTSAKVPTARPASLRRRSTWHTSRDRISGSRRRRRVGADVTDADETGVSSGPRPTSLVQILGELDAASPSDCGHEITATVSWLPATTTAGMPRRSEEAFDLVGRLRRAASSPTTMVITASGPDGIDAEGAQAVWHVGRPAVPDRIISSSSLENRDSIACSACCLVTSRLRNRGLLERVASRSWREVGSGPEAEQPGVDVAHRALDEEQRRPADPGQVDLQGWWADATVRRPRRECGGIGSASCQASGAQSGPPPPVAGRGRGATPRARRSAPPPREIGRRERVAAADQAGERALSRRALDARGRLGDRGERHRDRDRASGSSADVHASTRSVGVVGVSCSVRPKIRPGALRARHGATNAAASVARHKPLVSTSSVARTYGEGSGSSVLCSHSTSRSTPGGPGTSSVSSSVGVVEQSSEGQHRCDYPIAGRVWMFILH